MPTNNLSTAREPNNLIEFRQTVYEQILSKGRDAQFELIDALLLNDHPVFPRYKRLCFNPIYL